MMTWQWVFFAAIILVANGSENQETDHCGNEEKSSTPPTTTTMKPTTRVKPENDHCGKEEKSSTPPTTTTTMVPTTTACPCSMPPFLLPFTNDKYTNEWWSNIKDEKQSSYNSSFFVEAGTMRRTILENGCSIAIDCFFFLNENRPRVDSTVIVVTPDNQVGLVSIFKESQFQFFKCAILLIRGRTQKF
ncbi:unnamed protein product [Caenorhabditis nigoni]